MRRFDWESICRWVVTLSLTFVMFRPVSNNQVLLPALVLFGIGSLILAIKNRRRLAPLAVIPILIMIALGLYGSMIGLGNPGVANGALVWIVAPVLYGLWVCAGDLKLLRMTLFASAVVTIALSTIALVYVAASLAHVALFPRWVLAQLGMSFDGTSGTAITLYGLSTLVATAPMWLTALVLPRHHLLPNKWVVGVAAVTSLGASMVAGRAALTVVTIAVPVVVWVVWRIYSRHHSRTRVATWAPFVTAGGVVVALAALAVLGNSSVAKASGRVVSVFTGSGQTIDDKIRAVEAHELINAWATSPVFGHGLGAVISGYSRSGARPWNFELQYHLILFNLGLIGAGAVIAVLIVALAGVIRALKREPDMAPVLLVTISGAVALLIANASDPYLQAPGNMWPVYLVLMVVNVILSGNRPAKNAPPIPA